MRLDNRERLPEEIRNTVTDFLGRINDVLGDGIISIMAYGSVTGPDFNKKSSDVNLAIVMDEVTIDGLKPVLSIVKKGLKRGISTPLFLTISYIEMSLDTFPIEFSEMKDTRCLLYGKDILSDIEINREDLRRECETQLKGKLLVIRQAYLEQSLGKKGLERLLKMSLKALIPVFRALLRVKSEGDVPSGKREVLKRLGEEFSFDAGPFMAVLEDVKSDGRIDGKEAVLFLEEFLTRLESLSVIVDRL